MGSDIIDGGDLWIWRGIRLQIPADWEMLRYSLEPASGRCAFADRSRFRLEFNWKQMQGEPDMDRMVSDYRSKMESEGMQETRLLARGAWNGFSGVEQGAGSSRFGRFFRESNLLIEVVFPWGERRDRTTEKRVLDGVEEDPVYGDGLRRWRAFGMDFLVPERLVARECVVECARAEMVFSDEEGREEERFSRLGMVSNWLTEGVGEWLRSRAQGKIEVLEESVLRRPGGHEMHRLAVEKKVPALRHRRRSWEGLAWKCPRDGRLYSMIGSRPLKNDQDGEADIDNRLSCCPDVRLPA